jgi:hypothetical protein
MKDTETMIAAFYLSDDAKHTFCRLRVPAGLTMGNFAWLAVMLVRHIAMKFKVDEDDVWKAVEAFRDSEQDNPSNIVRQS